MIDGHWKLEAEHLFKTSLARAQFDAWSIASAEDHDDPTYIDTLPDEAKGKMCGLFKFRAAGYVNIHVWWFVVMIFVWPLAFFLSIETKTYGQLWQRLQEDLRHFRSGNLASQPSTAAVAGEDDHIVDSTVAASSQLPQSNNEADMGSRSTGSSANASTTESYPSPTVGSVHDQESAVDTAAMTTTTPLHTASEQGSTLRNYGSISSEPSRSALGRDDSMSDTQEQTDNAADQHSNPGDGWSPLLFHSIVLNSCSLIAFPFIWTWRRWNGRHIRI